MIEKDRIADYFGHPDGMYCSAIDEMPIDYDWCEHPYDFDDSGVGWRVADQESIDEILSELEDVELKDGDKVAVTISPPDRDGDIELLFDEHSTFDEISQILKPFEIDISQEDIEFGSKDFTRKGPFDQSWLKLLSLWDLEGELFFHEEDDFQPMMNFAYPLPDGFRGDGDWRKAMSCMTLVTIDGRHYLALTGCGMDLSWEICETYLRCGYWPPIHFAQRLPKMSGRGVSEMDKMIIEACRVSLEIARGWIDNGLESLEGLKIWSNANSNP